MVAAVVAIARIFMTLLAAYLGTQVIVDASQAIGVGNVKVSKWIAAIPAPGQPGAGLPWKPGNNPFAPDITPVIIGVVVGGAFLLVLASRR